MKLSDLIIALIAALACLATVSFGLESDSKELSEGVDNEMEMLEREIRSIAKKKKRIDERNQKSKPPRRRNKGRGRKKPNRRRNRQRKTTTKRRPIRATPTPPRPQAQGIDDDEYLEKFGYLARPKLGNVQLSPAQRKEAINNFQRFNHLKITGLLDAATRAQMAKPRCGLPDMIPAGVKPGEEALRNPSRKNPEKYYVPGFKWKKNKLTWLARNYSPDLPSSNQRRAFYEAFEHWSKVAPLDFNELGAGDPDIEIKFASYQHDDGPQNAFDGRGGTLAHAYFPENGDTHFDESETWTEYTHDGTNLMIVAAHEFGHALGLGHSNVRGALMAPYYQGYMPNFKLHHDDIMAIQSLYGSRPKPTPKPTPSPPKPPKVPTTTSRPRPTTTRKPTVPGAPNMCTTKFDAVVQAHDYKIYIFKGKYIWSTTPEGVEEGYPKLIKQRFEKPPINMGSAVYSWRTRRTYFFKGRFVFKYYGFKREAKVKITDSYYPRQPHAALMGRDGRIYLLLKDKYYIFDEYNMRTLNIGERKIAGLWPGVPNNIEAAVRLRDGYVYFFKGSRYRKYDERNRRVLPGYPKDKAAPWMGPKCSKNGKIVPK